MKLSELFELSPLGWEEAKRETIKQSGEMDFELAVKIDLEIAFCFIFSYTENKEMWDRLYYDNDPTLLKEWEAKQIK